MKKVGIKVLKPFSYRGKMRKVNETLGVNKRFAEAMILLRKAEPFEKQQKSEQPAPVRRRGRPRNTAIKPEEVVKQVVEPDYLDLEGEKADDE